MSLLRLVVGLLCCILAQAALRANPDQITNLPGVNFPINFNQYGGYLTVNPAHGKKLFYWFVESQNKPATDPVVLWLNGGPGCSSLIGFLSENGPFRPLGNTTSLYLNPYSWNNIANMLYLEAPAGVGFSYSNDDDDYYTGDLQTAEDNYAALLQFFKKFPQYIGNQFYLSGESYAGHYIPQLAAQILEGNSGQNVKINLQGLLVGNGLTVLDIDLNSPIPVFVFHGMIPWYLWQQIEAACQGNYIDNDSPTCNDLLDKADDGIGNIDPYDIYAPVCTQSKGFLRNNPILNRMKGLSGDQPFDPCIDLHLSDYLNREDVRQAIHADDAAGVWNECSGKLNYNFSTNVNSSMIPYYSKFFSQSKLNILIYSGDVDAVVPFLGTEQWITNLNRAVKEDWRSWTLDQQVGGYVIKYDSLTYLTIRGAGHMVPYFKPDLAYAFFERYITGQPF